MPRRKSSLPIAPEWLEMLRAAVARAGSVRAVAAASKVSHQTLMRMLAGERLSDENVAAVRAGLAKLGETLPPPVVAISSLELAAWLALGESLIASDPAAVAAACARPAGVRSAVKAAKPAATRRTR